MHSGKPPFEEKGDEVVEAIKNLEAKTKTMKDTFEESEEIEGEIESLITRIIRNVISFF